MSAASQSPGRPAAVDHMGRLTTDVLIFFAKALGILLVMVVAFLLVVTSLLALVLALAWFALWLPVLVLAALVSLPFGDAGRVGRAFRIIRAVPAFPLYWLGRFTKWWTQW